MQADDLPDMLRVDEAAAVLRISRARAYEEVGAFHTTRGARGIPSIRVGRCIRVPKRALLDWIDCQLQRSGAPGPERGERTEVDDQESARGRGYRTD